MSDIDDRNPEDATASRLFDLRTLIGGLFVLYGVLLFVVGLLDNDQEISKANGIRINLWLGASMFVLGALFLIWVRTRPLRLERHPLHEDEGPRHAEGGRRYDEGAHDEGAGYDRGARYDQGAGDDRGARYDQGAGDDRGARYDEGARRYDDGGRYDDDGAPPAR